MSVYLLRKMKTNYDLTMIGIVRKTKREIAPSYCPKRKPEIVAFYNHTKEETDIFDQMCHAYTTARVTRKWPLRLFFGMLLVVVCHIIQSISVKYRANRRNFIKELTLALINHIFKLVFNRQHCEVFYVWWYKKYWEFSHNKHTNYKIKKNNLLWCARWKARLRQP